MPLGEKIQSTIRDMEGIMGSHRTRERGLLASIASTIEKLAVAEAQLKALHELK